MTLQTTITNKSSQVEELQRKLDKKDTELKKTEELRISSSHDSEVIKHQRDFAVQFSYMIPDHETQACKETRQGNL